MSSSSLRFSAASSRVTRRASAWASVDDQIRFSPCLLLHLLTSSLGRDQRRAKEHLELLKLRVLGLELLHALGKAGALLPDLFETAGDLLEELFDFPAWISAEPCPPRDRRV